MKILKSKIAANHAKWLEPWKYLCDIVIYFETTDSAKTMPQQTATYLVWVVTKHDENSEKIKFHDPSRDILEMSTAANEMQQCFALYCIFQIWKPISWGKYDKSMKISCWDMAVLILTFHFFRDHVTLIWIVGILVFHNGQYES